MINAYSISMGVACVIAMALSYSTPRAWVWIGFVFASYVAGTLFWQYADQRMLPIFNFIMDAAICLLIWYYAQEIWEGGVFNAMWASTLVSIICMAVGPLMPDYIYANLLDICSYAALAVIGGVGLIESVGRHDSNRLSGLRDHLRTSRRVVR